MGESRNQESGVRSHESGVRSQDLEVRSQDLEVKSQEESRITEKLRFKASPHRRKSGRSSELPVGWDGEVSVPSGTLRVSCRSALTKFCVS